MTAASLQADDDSSERTGVAYQSAVMDWPALFTTVEGDMVKIFGGF